MKSNLWGMFSDERSGFMNKDKIGKPEDDEIDEAN